MPLNFKFGADSSEVQSEMQASAKSIEDNSAKIRTSFAGMASDTQRHSQTSSNYVGQYARDVQKNAQLMTREIETFRSAFAENFDAIGAKMRDQSGVFDSFAQDTASKLLNLGVQTGETAIRIKAWWNSIGAGMQEVKHPIDTITEGFGKLSDQISLAARNAGAHLGKSFLDNATNLAGMNRETGISVSLLQDLDGVSKASGVSLDTLKTVYKTLQSAMSGSSEEAIKSRLVLETMGISMDEGSRKSMTFQGLLAQIADRFTQYEDGAKKNALANDVLGSSEQKLIGLLNQGGQSLSQYMKLAEEKDSKISDSAVKRSEQLKNTLQIETAEQELSAKKDGEAWAKYAIEMERIRNSDLSGWDRFKSQVTGLWTAIAASAEEKAGRIQKAAEAMVPSAFRAKTSGSGSNSGVIPASPLDLQYPVWWLTPPGEALPGGAGKAGGKEDAPKTSTFDDYKKELSDIKEQEQNWFTWDAEHDVAFWRSKLKNAKEGTETAKQIYKELQAARKIDEKPEEVKDEKETDTWYTDKVYQLQQIHDAEQNVFKSTQELRQIDLAFWKDSAAESGLSADNQIRAIHEIQAIRRAAFVEQQAQEQQANSILGSMKRQEAEAEIRIESDKIKSQYELGKISAGQRLALENELYQKEYQAAINAKYAELDVQNQSVAQQAKIYKEIEKLQLDHRIKMANAEAQMVAERKREADEIASHISGSFNSMLFSTQTWAQKAQSLFQRYAQMAIDWGVKKVVQAWVLGESEKTTATSLGALARAAIERITGLGGLVNLITSTVSSWVGGETAKTAATVAGATARSAATVAQIAENVALAFSAAGLGAAAAGASVAAIPFIGWSMVPAVTAETYALLAGFAGMASLDVGAWNIPGDMIAKVHAGETVLPATFASGFRDAVSGKGNTGSSEIHNHYWQVMDSKSIKQMLSEHDDTIWKLMGSKIRKFKHLGGQ